MSRRRKINAAVTCWYASTGVPGPVGDVGDISSLQVALPGLDWLHRISIDVNAKNGEVSITVEPSDEKAANAPRLTMGADGIFTVRS